MIDGKFTSKADFEETATTQDYIELQAFYNAGTNQFPTKDSPKPDCKYQFSATSALVLLRDYGLKGQQQDLIFTEIKKDFTKKSIAITSDNWDRLQTLYDRYPTRDSRYVLDRLLDEILTKYGV